MQAGHWQGRHSISPWSHKSPHFPDSRVSRAQRSGHGWCLAARAPACCETWTWHTSHACVTPLPHNIYEFERHIWCSHVTQIQVRPHLIAVATGPWSWMENLLQLLDCWDRPHQTWFLCCRRTAFFPLCWVWVADVSFLGGLWITALHSGTGWSWFSVSHSQDEKARHFPSNQILLQSVAFALEDASVNIWLSQTGGPVRQSLPAPTCENEFTLKLPVWHFFTISSQDNFIFKEPRIFRTLYAFLSLSSLTYIASGVQ